MDQKPSQISPRRWIAPADARAVSQWGLWVALDDPDNLPGGINLVQAELDPNTGLIDRFEASVANPGLRVWSYPDDQLLSIAEPVKELDTNRPDDSVVVAKIISDKCSVIAGYNKAVPGSIGSLFKTWIVGAIASGIQTRDISPNNTVTFVRGDCITAGARSTGRFTSKFELTAHQPSNLMINISDNGATGVMKDFVGRGATTE
ncbi:MAG: serine hydrolase [Acidimicrobiales bacterium]